MLSAMNMGRARLAESLNAAAKVALSLAGGLCASILLLAAVPATGESHWPLGLDLVRRHPWPSVGACVVATIFVVPLLSWLTDRLSRLIDRRRGGAVTITSVPAPVLPDWMVPRPQVRAAAAAVCSRHRKRTVAITTTIHGAGGFGKTSAAVAVCADRRVQRRFEGRVHMVSVGLDVRSPSAIAALVGRVTRLLTGNETTFETPDAAGEHLAALLKDAPATLLVLDDVWHDEQVAPFRRAGGSLVLLVTTRRPGILPATARRFQVDEMRADESRAVLVCGLALTPGRVDELAEACGNWPLLLRLANRMAVALVSTGMLPDEAATQVLDRLRAQGPVGLEGINGLNLADPGQRERAVSTSLELAFELLPTGARERFAELGVFASTERVPIELVTRYWGVTCGLEESEARLLCHALASFSLLELSPERGSLRLHDVYGDILRAELGDRLPQLHIHLVQAAAQALPSAELFPGSRYSGPAWWRSPDRYVSDHLIEHIITGGQRSQAEALACDLRWMSARLRSRGANALLRDLARVGTATAAERSRDLSRIFHLLRPATIDRALPAILASRLANVPAWNEQATALTVDPALRPLLVNGWLPADVSEPAMLRTFPGISTPVTAVAFTHDAGLLAIGTRHGAQIADQADGRRRTVLTTSSWFVDPVVGLCFSRDDAQLAAVTREHRLVVANVAARGPRRISFAKYMITPGGTSFTQDGSWLSSSAFTSRVCLREPFSYKISCRFKGAPWKSPVLGPDRTWLAAIKQAEADEAWVWDLDTGEPRQRLEGHAGKVTALALSPNGTLLASSGDDATVRLWDTATWNQCAVLRGHEGPVTALIYSPDGTWVASSGTDGIIRFWSPQAPYAQLAAYSGHSGRVTALAVAVDGTRIASGGADGTARVWQAPGDRAPAPAPDTQGIRNFSVPAYADGSFKRSLTSIKRRKGSIPRAWYPSPAKPTDLDAGMTVILRRYEGWVPQVTVSPDGLWVASGSMDRIVRIWDPESGTIMRTLDHNGLAFAVAGGPSGAYVASADLDGTIRFSDPFSGDVLRTLGHSGDAPSSVTSLALAPDGSWLAARSWRGGLHIWQADACSWTSIPSEFVYAMAISWDGSKLAIRNKLGVQIKKRPTGQRIFAADSHSDIGIVHTLAFSPDDRHLIAGDAGSHIQVWDTQSPTRRPGKAKSSTISLMSQPYALAFSPDGHWLASTHADETLRIWDVATWQLAAEMRAMQWFGACAWAPDGSRLYVLGQNTLYRYDWRP